MIKDDITETNAMNHHLLSPNKSINRTKRMIVEIIKPKKLNTNKYPAETIEKIISDLRSTLPFSFLSQLSLRPWDTIEKERMRRKKEIIKGNKYGESFHSTLKLLWEIKDITTPKSEIKNKTTPSQNVDENFLFSTINSFP